ncbi:MAG: ChaN family lipoprotein [Oceanidesulfovibrio sp.]
MAAKTIEQGDFFVVAEQSARPLERAEFLERVQDADYILIGEGHTSRCDHEAQADILRWLATSRPSGPAVALEMVGVDRQPGLDLFNRGELGAHDLSVVLDWDRSWGHEFLAYGPVFAEAARHRLPLYAANLPQGAARAFGRGGAEGLAPEHRKYLPETIIPAGEPQREELREVFEAHAAMMQARSEQNGTLDGPATRNGTSDKTRKPIAATPATTKDEDVRPEEAEPEKQMAEADTPAQDGDNPPDSEAMFERFITVQSLWDTVMAENAVRVREREGSPVVVLAGSGHVDFGWGVGLRLAHLDPEATVVLVAPWRTDPAEQTPPETMADVYFYCPLPPGTRMMGAPAPGTDQEPASEENSPADRNVAKDGPGEPEQAEDQR